MVMHPTNFPVSGTPSLAELLRRNDIWRGQSQRFSRQSALDTGYSALNAALLNQGWPLKSLIEVCQASLGNGEWQLLWPLLRQLAGGYVVLLNPPCLPFAQSLMQAGVDLDRLLVVNTSRKADFLASFIELSRSSACEVLLAWQPQQALSYTELRKCLLATAEGSGVYFLWRPVSARQQSSPASLRLGLEIKAQALHIHIFKQRGLLQQQPEHAISLPLPDAWQGHWSLADTAPHLGVATAAAPATKPSRAEASVIPLVRGK